MGAVKPVPPHSYSTLPMVRGGGGYKIDIVISNIIILKTIEIFI